jgi:hypothetical protein
MRHHRQQAKLHMAGPITLLNVQDALTRVRWPKTCYLLAMAVLRTNPPFKGGIPRGGD